VEESRTTWLLFALIALAGRLAEEDPEGSMPASRTAAVALIPRSGHPSCRLAEPARRYVSLCPNRAALRSSSVNRRIFRAAISVSGAAIVVKIVATVKEFTVAGVYGRSDAMDAFSRRRAILGC